MHRNFVFSGDLEELQTLARKLEPLAEIITLQLDEKGSLKPRGAVLNVQTLNSAADEVLRHIQGPVRRGKIVVAIGTSAALVDVLRQNLIEHDADEMLWEEMEQNLRNEGRLSTNQVILMALAGSLAAASMVALPLVQVFGLVAASIIAPGYPPIAAIPLGLLLRRWRVMARATLAAAGGYGALILAAFLTFHLLRASGAPGSGSLENEGAIQMFGLQPASWIISVTSALAGAMMIVSLREIYVVGPLIGLVLIPASAAIGCALAIGDGHRAKQALLRAAVDVALVMVSSFLVFWWKQRAVHKRRPLV